MKTAKEMLAIAKKAEIVSEAENNLMGLIIAAAEQGKTYVDCSIMDFGWPLENLKGKLEKAGYHIQECSHERQDGTYGATISWDCKGTL